MIKVTPPSSPPAPLTPEEEAIVSEARKVFETMNDRPLATSEFQEKVAGDSASTEEETEDTPLI